MTVTVQQLFHGYSRGHRRLAGTLELSPSDADAVDQLSDLTGMLPATEAIDFYYTAYPLPSGKWYAFARTWLDEKAPRAGCVMTQTLLLSKEDERNNSDLTPLIRHFAEDVTGCYTDIKRGLEPIKIVDFQFSQIQPKFFITNTSDSKLYLTLLVRWFFATRTRPLILFGNALGVGDILAFRSLLWDEMRSRFSFCTLALQPISRPDAEFDLLMAPISSETRFYQRGTTIMPSVQSGPSEGWIRTYQEALFQGNQSELIDLYRIGTELACLSSDPVVLPLLSDLARANYGGSHANFLEALTLIKRLAPGRTQGLKGKKHFMRSAFEEASRQNRGDDDQFGALTDLLIACQSDELADAFAECEGIAKEAVTRVFSRDVDRSLDVMTRLKPDLLPRVEVEAIAETLIATARNHTVSLSALPQEWVAALLGASDMFVEALQASLSPKDFERVLRNSVTIVSSQLRIRLLLAVQGFAVVRREFNLLSLAYELADPETAAELFCDLPDTANSPLWLAAEAFARYHTAEAHQTARQKLAEDTIARKWRYLYVLSQPLTAAGIAEVLDLVSKDVNNADLLQMYLQRFGMQRIDSAIRDYLASQSELISELIRKACMNPSPALLTALERLIMEVSEIDIVLHPEILDALEAASLSFESELIRRSINHAIRAFLERKMPQGKIATWVKSSSFLTWIENQSAKQMQALLRASASSTSSSRLIKLLLLMPDMFWKRFGKIIFDVIREHTDRASDQEFVAVCQPWLELVNKVNQFDQGFIVLKLRFYALFKAFELVELPVSALVVDSFSPVHEYLCLDRDDREMESVLSYIPWPTWDKAKYIRKRLVAAFSDSSWPMIDLVKACGSPDLLRKILQRLKKSTRGEITLQALCRLASNAASEIEAWRRQTVLDVAGGRSSSDEWI